jgi:hypothetical protein
MMFSTKLRMSFEGTPIEIVRRYAPYIIGAMAAVGVVASLYYSSFDSSQSIIAKTSSSTTTTIDDSHTIIDNVFNRITP